MGNCDFTKSSSTNNEARTVNKNLFIQEYILGKGGYGKVFYILYLGMASF